jgi:hypothetical protein
MTASALAALMAEMNFTSDDLDANRQRRLSMAQRQRLRRLQRRTLAVGAAVFVLMAFVAAVCIYLGQTSQQALWSLLGVLTTVLNAIVCGFIARSYLRLAADMRADGAVSAYSGVMERVLRHNNRAVSYVLRLGGHRFVVTKEVFRVFEHEKPYVVYATVHADVLLSAEPLASTD